MPDFPIIESTLQTVAASVALLLELGAIVVIAIGSVTAIAGMARGAVRDRYGPWKRIVWLHYAAWIVLSLEFALAADICRTAISPTWDDIGRLGAIAAIRTVLSFFLNRDVEELGQLTSTPEEKS